MSMIRDLEDRREALVLRSTLQRAQLSARLAPAAHKLAVADRVAATVRAHPILAGIGLTGLLLIGPRRLVRWAVRGAPFYSGRLRALWSSRSV
jgi:hypothetical protein